ncbi:uncharacterized protein LOC114538980 [Dendronephthya gigantea]|uniref:uncharacterized protein LOC114538980 n=1 Tax=Dendronephthya gigantea TaxID=151771 RepID=UPI00106C0B81|nr:uncharacterized protein LOC114538980 [Dendronephthya gigantea]
MYLKIDVMCVLPTGHLLPMLLLARFKLRGDLLLLWRSKGICTASVDSIVIVVSPLNSLMSDQISRLGLSGIRASVVNIKPVKTTQDETKIEEDDVNIDFWLCEEQKFRDGYYHIVFAHRESFISCKHGRDSLMSEKYTDNVVAIVIHEAHCILDWGSDFRKDYGKLGALCALFPDVPVLAMTATASRADMQDI